MSRSFKNKRKSRRTKRGGYYCFKDCVSDGLSDVCQTCILNKFNEQKNLEEFFNIFAQSPKMKKKDKYTEKTKKEILEKFESLLPSSENEEELKKQQQELKNRREYLQHIRIIKIDNTGRVNIAVEYENDSLGFKILSLYLEKYDEAAKDLHLIIGGRRRRSRRKTRRGGKRRIYRHLAVKAFLKKTKRRRKKKKSKKKKKGKRRTKRRR